MQDKPKEPDVVTGAAQGPYCLRSDAPRGLGKAREVVTDGVRRVLGR